MLNATQTIDHYGDHQNIQNVLDTLGVGELVSLDLEIWKMPLNNG